VLGIGPAFAFDAPLPDVVPCQYGLTHRPEGIGWAVQLSA
jgi:hypothetical protein